MFLCFLESEQKRSDQKCTAKKRSCKIVGRLNSTQPKRSPKRVGERSHHYQKKDLRTHSIFVLIFEFSVHFYLYLCIFAYVFPYIFAFVVFYPYIFNSRILARSKRFLFQCFYPTQKKFYTQYFACNDYM